MEVSKRVIYQTALDCVRDELDCITDLDDGDSDIVKKFEQVIEYLENEVDNAK